MPSAVELVLFQVQDIPHNLNVIEKKIPKAPFDRVSVKIDRPFQKVKASPDSQEEIFNENEDLQAWDDFFSALAKLQPTTLHLQGQMPLAALAKIVQTPTLTNLELEKVVFVGKHEHMTILIEALSQSPLKYVSVDECFMCCSYYLIMGVEHQQAPSMISDCFFDFAKAITALPHLERLDWVHPRFGHHLFEILTHISRSSHLRHLEISIEHCHQSMRLGFEGWASAIRTWQHSNIRSLIIANLSDEHIRRFLPDTCVQSIADFLVENRTLQHLDISVEYIHSAAPIIRALKTNNRTLESLTLNGKKIPNEETNATFISEVLAMLKENSILNKLETTHWKKPKEVQDYLLMNRAGRATVLGQEVDPTFDWSEALAKCARNLSGLYFFIRQNPNLLKNVHCLPDGPGSQPKTKKRKRKHVY